MSSRVEIPRTPFDFIEAHPNVFQLILEYCVSSIDDLKNVGLTNKATYKKTWTHLMASVMGRNNMKLLLRNFGLPYSEFMRTLRDSNAVISGSFALQAVMGDKASFSADDIDIYVSSNQNLDILNSFLEDNGYEFVERDVPPGVIHVGEDEDIVYHMNPVFCNFFKGVRDYKQTAGEGKVQIIEMQEGRLVTQASDLYDMTMVQVLMHPVPVTALNDESVGVLRVLEMNDYISFAIKHPADIYNRRLKLNPQWTIAMKTIEQLYVARGFLFEGDLLLSKFTWADDVRTCAYYMLKTDDRSFSDDAIIKYFNQNSDMWYQPCRRSRNSFDATWPIYLPIHLLCKHYRPKVIKKLLATLPDIVHKSRRTYGTPIHECLPSIAELTETLVKAGIVDVWECVERNVELEQIREIIKSNETNES